jgi:hypothetical protein
MPNSLRKPLEPLRGLKSLVGAEIGVGAGSHAKQISSRLDMKRLYLVDPYVEYTDTDIHGAVTEYPQELLDRYKKGAMSLPALQKDCVKWIFAGGSEAANQVPTESLDFIWIDGSHTEETVESDLYVWYPKVKPGGLFAGHDYILQVRRAVDSFMMKVGLTGQVRDKGRDGWWVFKPGARPIIRYNGD